MNRKATKNAENLVAVKRTLLANYVKYNPNKESMLSNIKNMMTCFAICQSTHYVNNTTIQKTKLPIFNKNAIGINYIIDG